jgi:hypothetical protein
MAVILAKPLRLMSRSLSLDRLCLLLQARVGLPLDRSASASGVLEHSLHRVELGRGARQPEQFESQLVALDRSA